MIETLTDWNTRLGYCSCCPMPECPQPLLSCEAKYGSIDRNDLLDEITYDVSGDYYDGDPHEYRSFRPAYTGGVSLDEITTIYLKNTWIYEELLNQDPHDLIVDCAGIVKTYTQYFGHGVGLSVRQTLTLSEPITKEELEDKALAKMDAEEWTTLSCSAVKVSNWPVYPPDWEACEPYERGITTFGANAGFRKIRFRFRIPHTHTGSKYYISYDIAEFPEEGDPSFFSEDNVIEWTGPGTGASSDPSWLTDWFEIDPPEVPGERRIVNIRYTCYAGTKFGSKPQVMGEALEIPPP